MTRTPSPTWIVLICALSPPVALAQDGAIAFSGGDDRVVLGDLRPGIGYSVELWAELDLVGDDTLICAADDAFLNAMCIQYRNGTWLAEINDSDEIEGNSCNQSHPHVCVDDDLGAAPAVVHVALSVNALGMMLFLDGVQVGSDWTLQATDWTDATWVVGSDLETAGWNDPLEGRIDEVRIWNRYRFASEIACTRDYALTGTERGLVGHWAFDDAPGGVSPDTSGNGFDATLFEAAAVVASPFGLTASVGGDIPCYDYDGDAFTPDEGDCDDTNPDVRPNATGDTWYDGVDLDCDGANDYDADGDGFVHADWPAEAGGTAPGTGDCNDADPDIHPDAPDGWYDGADTNCDGANDYDRDGDGFVDEAWPDEAGGTAPGVGDCDDDDPNRNPGEVEVFYDGLDADCGGDNDYDADGDGFVHEEFSEMAGGTAPSGGDCDDDDPGAHPGGTEVWYDGIDQDCLAGNDYDADGDGYVGANWDGQEGGTAPGRGDCDDVDDSIHPGAIDEWYDGIDVDCDGRNDYDQDLDGYVSAQWNEAAGGTAPDGDDCDDLDGAVNPGAADVIGDGIDQNCNGQDMTSRLHGGLEGGCGCDGGTSGRTPWGALAVLLIVRRRRRPGAVFR